MNKEQIKNQCEICNVEPPAMKFKCPECEHNPDKDQIIIDGMDVSKCEHYQYESLELVPLLPKLFRIMRNWDIK